MKMFGPMMRHHNMCCYQNPFMMGFGMQQGMFMGFFMGLMQASVFKPVNFYSAPYNPSGNIFSYNNFTYPNNVGLFNNACSSYSQPAYTAPAQKSVFRYIPPDNPATFTYIPPETDNKKEEVKSEETPKSVEEQKSPEAPKVKDEQKPKTEEASTQKSQEVVPQQLNTSGIKLNKDKNLYGPAFLNKVQQIAKDLNCDYKDLLAVMNCESGISTTAKNPKSSATGLIQFVESTAKSLGTTTDKLAKMTPLEQLDYVEKYLHKTKAEAGFSADHRLTAGELYALVFLPARANREVLTTADEKYYQANKGLDKNGDGKITKTELEQKVKSRIVSDKSFIA